MKRRIQLQQKLINHVVFVLDASVSMRGKERELISVADELIGFLKEKSQSYGQETRVTMYIFGQDTQAACYDVDVLRTPTIKGLYEATGPSTSLIDAAYQSIEELQQTATLYGDHSFLVYVLTDGQENSSGRNPDQLRRLLVGLPVEWTVAALVPDQLGQRYALQYGFSLENILIWDAQTKQGVVEVGASLQNATESYFNMRSTGTRGTKGLFQASTAGLSKDDVIAKALPVRPRVIIPVHENAPIREYVEQYTSRPYVIGSAYYQLTKAEDIQPQKQILLRHRFSGAIYGGEDARRLINLPDYQIRVAPGQNPEYDVFVQSTSVNRKLVAGTSLIIM